MKAIWLLLSFAAFVGCASIKELEEKIDGLQKQNTSLQSPDDPQIKALIKISDELNIKIIDDLQKKNTFLRSENVALQADITGLRGETASLKSENEALQADINRLQDETASLQKNTIDEIRRLNRQITEKEHELKGLRKIE